MLSGGLRACRRRRGPPSTPPPPPTTATGRFNLPVREGTADVRCYAHRTLARADRTAEPGAAVHGRGAARRRGPGGLDYRRTHAEPRRAVRHRPVAAGDAGGLRA